MESSEITVRAEDQLFLEKVLEEEDFDIVFAGRLLQNWKSGRTKRDIVFEQVDGNIHPLAATPPDESPAFLKERWNPFHGFFVLSDRAKKALDAAPLAPSKMLNIALEEGFSMKIVSTVSAVETISLNFHAKTLKEFIGSNEYLRALSLQLFRFANNVKQLFTAGREYAQYKKEIQEIIRNKEIVLALDFGGLGDCLSYTTLPRLLSEKYDIHFYLDERSRSTFRHPDILELCFLRNPYFRGFKKTDTPFRSRFFVQELSIWSFITGEGGDTAAAMLEHQFSLDGAGKPEIYYAPQIIQGYDQVLLCDNNWHSGEKWGLHNNPAIMNEIIEKWKSSSPHHRVEFLNPTKQTIFQYIDKIASCGKFVTYFSGGNPLAVALGKKAVVILPTNLTGTPVSMFKFTNSETTYIQN